MHWGSVLNDCYTNIYRSLLSYGFNLAFDVSLEEGGNWWTMTVTIQLGSATGLSCGKRRFDAFRKLPVCCKSHKNGHTIEISQVHASRNTVTSFSGHLKSIETEKFNISAFWQSPPNLNLLSANVLHTVSYWILERNTERAFSFVSILFAWHFRDHGKIGCLQVVQEILFLSCHRNWLMLKWRVSNDRGRIGLSNSFNFKQHVYIEYYIKNYQNKGICNKKKKN